MARLSKAHSFAVYEDAGIPTPDSGYHDPFEDIHEDHPKREELEKDLSEEEDTRSNLQPLNEEEEHEQNDEALTHPRTSISSVPDSTWQDQEPEEKPFVPPLIRPSFMRPESVRRMQMSSPPPYRTTPRQSSVLRHGGSGRSRMGTSRSRGSPRSRRQASERSESYGGVLSAEFPLVLLHVTLLPVVLPWSGEAVQELLPESVRAGLQLLRSKVTETMLVRGLLIPHPGAEYEVLEERLLEGLELREERVTRCGHFHGDGGRESMASSEGDGSDSGLGSSVEGLVPDEDVCLTCSSPVKTSRSGVWSGKQKWSIRVYAANGLMRAPAWAAAWNEMESVDVEILPWIAEETRQLLDERAEQEALVEAQREREAFEEERLRVLSEERAPWAAAHTMKHSTQTSVAQPPPLSGSDPDSNPRNEAPSGLPLSKPTTADLPQFYRPSQIPLSVLLRNYIFLLARDRRNVAIFFLGLLALWFAVAWSTPATVETSSMVGNEKTSLGLDMSEAAVAGVQGAASMADAAIGDTSQWMTQVAEDGAHEVMETTKAILEAVAGGPGLEDVYADV
ncbi:hypothetical protein LTR91_018436 [Friedmanniomyces endolithicus]|uniref:Pathway-specific nitrogen regulator n=1 Tax=Friedmanniomyces endolithicus TaxID=329885 RepID=A0AAN6K287_9PEZI|nr:hypothetical protein LTR94_014186 [Friedmanniomyces endolithicus]KAK0778934.1 hypothetical protein LTR75_015489 [Friedmanniomyces endolithicus]KAK0799758.1 hypothetical protein LTR38_007407 [Friedmanniomyces endolithicus]KAK0802340.1 hypothetical protein LTR59_005076 [Friedmanniomyces endolithicus]KAK0856378.1 hypothetical protein LTS02_010657 [Friedmanniomyces endolithicus]